MSSAVFQFSSTGVVPSSMESQQHVDTINCYLASAHDSYFCWALLEERSRH